MKKEEKIKEFYDIKVDKEYYEKLKTIDYSEVETTLDEVFKDYIYYDHETPYSISLSATYILIILQEPSLYKKIFFSSFSIEDLDNDPTLSDEIKIYIYMLFDKDKHFQDYIPQLINRFGKDKLLAFILFSFRFKDYLKNYNKRFSGFSNPLSDGLLKLFLNTLGIKENDEILTLYSSSDFIIESFLKNPNITIINNSCVSIDESLISNNIKSEIFRDKFGNTQSTFEYFKDRVSSKQKIDKIFLNLSIISYNKENNKEATIKYRDMIKNNFIFQDEVIKDSSLEWLFHILAINHLKDNGRAISLVEKNILSDPKNKNIRKYFIENGYIESIILLPENILIHYPVSLALIVFSKKNQKIRFIDASKFYKNEKIKVDIINSSAKNKKKAVAMIPDSDINKILNLLNGDNVTEISFSKKIENFSKNNYNLDVIENIDILPNFENGVELKKVIKNIIRGSQIDAKELNEIRTYDVTPYIYLTLSNINDGIIEFENIEEYLAKIPEKQEKFCIKNNSILLSKIGNPPYKIAVAQIPDDKKIIASGNFAIIEVDEKKLNPWYLIAFLTTDIGLKILKKAYIGSLHSSLSIKKLEDIIIPIPPIEEQEKIGKEYQKTINEIKEMKKELNDKIQITKEILKKYNGSLL